MTPEPQVAFDEPWQARVFALTQAILQDEPGEREDFRRRLATEIAQDPSREYWESWLGALEKLVRVRGLATPETMA